MCLTMVKVCSSFQVTDARGSPESEYVAIATTSARVLIVSLTTAAVESEIKTKRYEIQCALLSTPPPRHRSSAQRQYTVSLLFFSFFCLFCHFMSGTICVAGRTPIVNAIE
jgi:hypothetical protein